jgi:hypothetical protein
MTVASCFWSYTATCGFIDEVVSLDSKGENLLKLVYLNEVSVVPSRKTRTSLPLM